MMSIPEEINSRYLYIKLERFDQCDSEKNKKPQRNIVGVAENSKNVYISNNETKNDNEQLNCSNYKSKLQPVAESSQTQADNPQNTSGIDASLPSTGNNATLGKTRNVNSEKQSNNSEGNSNGQNISRGILFLRAEFQSNPALLHILNDVVLLKREYKALVSGNVLDREVNELRRSYKLPPLPCSPSEGPLGTEACGKKRTDSNRVGSSGYSKSKKANKPRIHNQESHHIQNSSISELQTTSNKRVKVAVNDPIIYSTPVFDVNDQSQVKSPQMDNDPKKAIYMCGLCRLPFTSLKNHLMICSTITESPALIENDVLILSSEQNKSKNICGMCKVPFTSLKKHLLVCSSVRQSPLFHGNSQLSTDNVFSVSDVASDRLYIDESHSKPRKQKKFGNKDVRRYDVCLSREGPTILKPSNPPNNFPLRIEDVFSVTESMKNELPQNSSDESMSSLLKVEADTEVKIKQEPLEESDDCSDEMVIDEFESMNGDDNSQNSMVRSKEELEKNQIDFANPEVINGVENLSQQIVQNERHLDQYTNNKVTKDSSKLAESNVSGGKAQVEPSRSLIVCSKCYQVFTAGEEFAVHRKLCRRDTVENNELDSSSDIPSVNASSEQQLLTCLEMFCDFKGTIDQLMKHSTAHERGRFCRTCRTCNKSFKSHSLLKSHFDSSGHSETYPAHVCPKCSFTTFDSIWFKGHVLNEHVKKKSVPVTT